MLKKIIICIVIITGYSCKDNKQDTTHRDPVMNTIAHEKVNTLHFGFTERYPDFYSTIVFKADANKTKFFSCEAYNNPNFSCDSITEFEIITSKKTKELLDVPKEIRTALKKETLLQLNDESYYILKFKTAVSDEAKEVYVSSDFSNLNQDTKSYMLKLSEIINTLEAKLQSQE